MPKEPGRIRRRLASSLGLVVALSLPVTSLSAQTGQREDPLRKGLELVEEGSW